MKVNKYILSVALASSLAGLMSCEDMLDKGNEYVIYTEGRELTDPADTVTNMLGIMTKMQAIGVRTNLLGEVRADLVKVNENATIDLKNLADFAADVTGEEDANVYNVPRDYYAIINNCNYYLQIADSTAGNTNRNELYFENEIAQVHSMRAWTYLQAVLAYGKVPFVIDPVITKIQSDAKYPMYDLEAICDYFINDLKPYYGQEYPDPGTVGGDVNPKLCYYPTQVVMGDLLLYKAVATRNPELAKEAAKAYYDYIMWDLSGKKVLTMSTNDITWSANSLYEEKYKRPSGSISLTAGSSWGTASSEGITVIPMDSASTSGVYNELRNLYNYTNKTTINEASISPTQGLIDLSESQEYYGYDTQKNVVKVARDKFEDEELEDHLFGDLRFQNFYSKRKITHNTKEYTQETNKKHNGQHVTVYRQTQLYLRLAEALNYAGYPRFAKSFLTIGPNNLVIKNTVQPYYTTPEDSAFLKYFDMNSNTFISYVEDYAERTDSLGMIKTYDPVYRAQTNTCTVWGIHSRGSGYAFLNPNYGIEVAPDSTNYPYDLAGQVGHLPVKEDYDYPTKPTEPKAPDMPDSWEKYPNQILSFEDYKIFKSQPNMKESAYNRYVTTCEKYMTYVNETYPQYVADVEEYEATVARLDAQMEEDMAAYDARHAVFEEAYNDWYKAAYSDPELIKTEQESVDQLILDEQALELSYEGNRFYDLMRRALWYNDNSRLAKPIGVRNSALEGKLMDRSNWYLHWKGQIGY